MIEYRAFLNSDPPLLAEIWRSQAGQRGLMQPMSALLFENLVLSKTIFDREGLILALDDGKPLGFAHAGFGATDDQQGLSTSVGVISMLMIGVPDCDPSVGDELLRRSENYLCRLGARQIVTAGVHPNDPFYLGLYGGSQLSGLLESDSAVTQFFQAHGYVAAERTRVLHRDLALFRPLVDRQQMLIRRRTRLITAADPPATSWWDACTFGAFERTRFELRAPSGDQRLAAVTFWNMEPLATTWGVHAAGLIELEVIASQQRQGLATYLLGEAFRDLHTKDTAMIEVQVRETNQAALALFNKLGFTQVDQAVVYRKPCPSETT